MSAVTHQFVHETDWPEKPVQIRGMHPYHFRSGKWAALLTIVPGPERDCYMVRFPDGVTDWWVVGDTTAGYEFRDAVQRE